MKFKKKRTANFTLLFSVIMVCLMLPLSAAADYKTKLNNELAALGLNNSVWLYDSESETNSDFIDRIKSNNECKSCNKTKTTGKANHFEKAYKIDATFKETASPWDGGIHLPSVNLTKGDKLLLVFWTKGSPSSGFNSGALQMQVKKPANFWIEKPSDKSLIPVSSSWEEWRIPIEIQGNKFAASGDFQARLRFGMLSQQFEIGGIALIKYNNSANIEAARKDASQTYEGIEDGAAWRTEALNRIDKVRKSNLNITVKDSNGKPISNATVLVEQQDHQFDFGVGQMGRMLVLDEFRTQTRKLILENCNTMGLGSDLLWNRYVEPTQNNVTKTELAEITNWAQSNNLRFRWHNTLWPGINTNDGHATYMPRNISNLISVNKDKPAFLNQVKSFINDVMENENGLGNLITEIDVINEPTFNRFLERYLGEDDAIDIYRKTALYFKENYPDKKLYINDHIGLAGGGYNIIGEKRLKEIVSQVNSGNKKCIDALGFQMHTKYPVPPSTLKSLLDDYNMVNELKITEFDLHGIHPEIRAQYLSDFMIMIFSLPKVNGFIFWDAIQDGSSNWFNHATPIYDEEGLIKDSGKAYRKLVFEDWSTNEIGKTDECGEATVSAFKGKQKVTVTYGNKTKTVEIDLNSDENVVLNLDANVTDVCTEEPNPETECDLIKNGDFTSTSNWKAYINPAANANWNNGEGVANYNVNNGSDADWKVQLYQTNLNLEAGKTYKVQFDAVADMPKQIYVKLSNNTDTKNYDKKYIQLSRNWETYSFNFISGNNSDSNGRISFGIGGNNININLDNVVVRDVNCGDYSICQEVVKNGSFTNNLNNFELLPFDGAQAEWYHNEWGEYASIKIQNGKDKRWKVQMRQRDIQLYNNVTYKLSFSSKADADKEIHVAITNAANTKIYMPVEYVKISNEWKRYEYEFTMSEPNNNTAYLNFSVGSNNTAIRFDAISLKEAGCIENKIKAKSTINIYPNPASQKVFVELPTEAAHQISLTDITGKVIKQFETGLNESTITINVNDLPKGMYIISLKNTSNQISQKLIIE